MITLEEAAALYLKKYPNRIIETVIDTEDEWVFSALDAESHEPLDISPAAISKQTGKFRVFFPPANAKKLKTAKYIKWEG